MTEELYPPIEPNYTDFLAVSELHSLYYEESGNPEGQPVVFLHGGPGGGVRPIYRQFFDPNHYRIIMFDQRGAGQSTPHAELKDNTTWDLVNDIETLREHLNIDSWLVFGGSWGSTLALTYAIKHPERVKALILRGIFLCRPHEIHWLYQKGASAIYPDAFDKYTSVIPPDERHDLVGAFYKRLTSEDTKTRVESAIAWSVWEASTSKLVPDPTQISDFGEDEFALAFARIECHYFINNSFYDSDNWILEHIETIRHIPTFVVHGRYDVVCPVQSAWDLKKAFPELELQIIQTAGHSAMEEGTKQALVRACENFKSL